MDNDSNKLTKLVGGESGKGLKNAEDETRNGCPYHVQLVYIESSITIAESSGLLQSTVVLLE